MGASVAHDTIPTSRTPIAATKNITALFRQLNSRRQKCALGALFFIKSVASRSGRSAAAGSGACRIPLDRGPSPRAIHLERSLRSKMTGARALITMIPVASGIDPTETRSSARSNSSTKTSTTRTGLSSPMQSSRHSDYSDPGGTPGETSHC